MNEMENQLTFDLMQSIKRFSDQLYKFSGMQEKTNEVLNLLSDNQKEQIRLLDETGKEIKEIKKVKKVEPIKLVDAEKTQKQLIEIQKKTQEQEEKYLKEKKQAEEKAAKEKAEAEEKLRKNLREKEEKAILYTIKIKEKIEKEAIIAKQKKEKNIKKKSIMSSEFWQDIQKKSKPKSFFDEPQPVKFTKESLKALGNIIGDKFEKITSSWGNIKEKVSKGAGILGNILKWALIGTGALALWKSRGEIENWLVDAGLLGEKGKRFTAEDDSLIGRIGYGIRQAFMSIGDWWEESGKENVGNVLKNMGSFIYGNTKKWIIDPMLQDAKDLFIDEKTGLPKFLNIMTAAGIAGLVANPFGAVGTLKGMGAIGALALAHPLIAATLIAAGFATSGWYKRIKKQYDVPTLEEKRESLEFTRGEKTDEAIKTEAVKYRERGALQIQSAKEIASERANILQIDAIKDIKTEIKEGIDPEIALAKKTADLTSKIKNAEDLLKTRENTRMGLMSTLQRMGGRGTGTEEYKKIKKRFDDLVAEKKVMEVEIENWKQTREGLSKTAGFAGTIQLGKESIIDELIDMEKKGMFKASFSKSWDNWTHGGKKSIKDKFKNEFKEEDYFNSNFSKKIIDSVSDKTDKVIYTYIDTYLNNTGLYDRGKGDRSLLLQMVDDFKKKYKKDIDIYKKKLKVKDAFITPIDNVPSLRPSAIQNVVFDNQDSAYKTSDGGILAAKPGGAIDKVLNSIHLVMQEVKAEIQSNNRSLNNLVSINNQSLANTSRPQQASEGLSSIPANAGYSREPASDKAYGFRTKAWEILHGVT